MPWEAGCIRAASREVWGAELWQPSRKSPAGPGRVMPRSLDPLDPPASESPRVGSDVTGEPVHPAMVWAWNAATRTPPDPPHTNHSSSSRFDAMGGRRIQQVERVGISGGFRSSFKALAPLAFSPCGRRWRAAPDEGFSPSTVTARRFAPIAQHRGVADPLHVGFCGICWKDAAIPGRWPSAGDRTCGTVDPLGFGPWMSLVRSSLALVLNR